MQNVFRLHVHEYLTKVKTKLRVCNVASVTN